MTSRLSTPDTRADKELRAILDEPERRCFVMVAGAGSGKTTSLIKALHHVATTQERSLRAHAQQIACVTYTTVATREIHAEAGGSPLVMVKTIHSFLWELVRPFQRDIRKWAVTQIEEEIAELVGKEHPPGTRQTTKNKDAARVERLKARLGHLAERGHARFTYGVASDFSKGIVGHSDVLKMTTSLILNNDLFSKIIASKYPYIFVDESQDTFPDVVRALKHVAAARPRKTCIGFFGDPMQQIYQQGVGNIPAEEGWAEIKKPENFRCSTRVLAIANAVRARGDGLAQRPGRPLEEQREGESFFFILPADGQRANRLEQARSWLSRRSPGSGPWDVPDTKILTITHRMAASRLGFGAVFSAFRSNGNRNGGASLALKDAFEEGTAWPLRPFEQTILPLCDAESETSPEVIQALRADNVPALSPENGPASIREKLTMALGNVKSLREIVASAGPGSVGKALRLAATAGFLAKDPRILDCLGLDANKTDIDLPDEDREAFAAFCECDVRELRSYFTHINRNSPYSTQHGTKGAEFPKVIVVLDDDEGNYNLYSYEKLLGIKELSPKDYENLKAGGDSVIGRTRRLLYVCVTRAKDSLAIVLFVKDPAATHATLANSATAAGATIVTADDLAELRARHSAGQGLRVTTYVRRPATQGHGREDQPSRFDGRAPEDHSSLARGRSRPLCAAWDSVAQSWCGNSQP